MKEGIDSCAAYQKDEAVTKVLNAIEAHSIYITNVAKVVEGYQDITLKDFTSCDYGKWFYSGEAFKELRPYGDEVIAILEGTEDIHKDIHNLAHELVRLKKENRMDEVFDKFHELADTASELVKELTKIYAIIASKELD
ncbi:CZB domain-containing protein [Nitratiruptor sp. YY09-18]|uniref:CZB domain-containing protein n=1 Tax=Nitratiruptor sp. YY09-18 TaxID=2724901 RepID=UPI00351CAD01